MMNPQSATGDGLFDALSGIMNRASNEFTSDLKTDVAELFNICSEDMGNDSKKMIAGLILKALDSRMKSESADDHLYLKNYEIPQIELFGILIEKFPFVKYSQLIVNNAILQRIGDSIEAAIIDIGTGQGTQMLNIIEGCKHLPKLTRLKIVGIEPFGDALAKAKENITACQGRVAFNIEFIPIHDFAENVDYSSFNTISDNLIVNASLALHHIQNDSKRQQTLDSISALKPSAFLLIEPNSNHFEPNLYNRFVNCYNHYYNLFRVIDGMSISHHDKNALKLFFGREIEDVIGKEEMDRYEKHEKAETWINRLLKSGFQMLPEKLVSPVSSECGVNIAHHPEGFIGFTFDTETILAVIYAEKG